MNKWRIQQRHKSEQVGGTYLHSPRSRLLSLAVLALFTHTGVSRCSSGFLFLLVSFAAAFLGVLLALAGSSSDTSPLPGGFPFFFASPPFLPPPPLDATGLLGGFLFFGGRTTRLQSEQCIMVWCNSNRSEVTPLTLLILILAFSQIQDHF